AATARPTPVSLGRALPPFQLASGDPRSPEESVWRPTGAPTRRLAHSTHSDLAAQSHLPTRRRRPAKESFVLGAADDFLILQRLLRSWIAPPVQRGKPYHWQEFGQESTRERPMMVTSRRVSSRASLVLRLFGPSEIRLNGNPLPRLRSRKERWLLALLALRHGAEVDRQWLAGMLWPESISSQTLRNTLADLRRALGPEAARLRSPTPRTLSLDLAGADVD